MRKVMMLLFLMCISLIAEDCFKMNRQVFCDNDVIRLTETGQSMLVKVNDIGGGRVHWDLYVFYFNPTSEQGLKGEAFPNTSDYYHYQFKLGNVTKIYSNTPAGRKKILKEFENKEKQIKQTAQQCHKGAIKNSNGSQRSQELLEIFCAYSIRYKFQPPKISLLGFTFKMKFPKRDTKDSLNYFLNPTWGL